MMRLRRRDAGISMVLVIVLIVFTLIITVLAAIFWANYKTAGAPVQDDLCDYQSAGRRGRGIREAAGPVQRATGRPWERKASSRLPARPRREEVARRVTSASRPEEVPLVAPLQKPGGAPHDEGGTPTSSTGSAKRTAYMRTLQALVNPRSRGRTHYKKRGWSSCRFEHQIARHKRSRERSLPRSQEEGRDHRGLQKEIARLNEEIAREKTQYNERKTKFTEDKTKSEARSRRTPRSTPPTRSRVNNEIRELKRQLEELKVKEVIKHEINFIHGKILNPTCPTRPRSSTSARASGSRPA
jgi:hypothetical protein